MANTDFAQEQRERDERAFAALHEHHADALARKRAQDEELERARRAFDRATTNARIATTDLDAVERALKLHRDSVAQRSAAMSPIQGLPLETLSRIFQFLLDPANARCQPSFIVAGVCDRWRRLALSSPELWSIRLNIRGTLAHASEYVKTVLDRSGQRPLLVYITTIPEVEWTVLRTLDAILQDVISRAGDLTISSSTMVFGSAPPIDLSKTIYQYLQLPTPRLRQLHIYGADVNLGDAQLLPSAPVLSSIDAHTLAFRAFVGASLPALRELTLMAQDQMPDLAVIGLSFPRLRHLCISRFRIRNDPQTSVPPPFVHLESLQVDGFDVLASFPPDGLPALTHLSLTQMRTHSAESVRMPDMPVLCNLSIYGQRSWTLALSLFDQFPGVESLVLHRTQFDGSSTPSFWTQWVQGDSVRALPRLRDMTLKGTANRPVDEVTGIWEFLQARTALRDGSNAVDMLQRLTLIHVALPRWVLLQVRDLVKNVVVGDTSA